MNVHLSRASQPWRPNQVRFSTDCGKLGQVVDQDLRFPLHSSSGKSSFQLKKYLLSEAPFTLIEAVFFPCMLFDTICVYENCFCSFCHLGLERKLGQSTWHFFSEKRICLFSAGFLRWFGLREAICLPAVPSTCLLPFRAAVSLCTQLFLKQMGQSAAWKIFFTNNCQFVPQAGVGQRGADCSSRALCHSTIADWIRR